MSIPTTEGGWGVNIPLGEAWFDLPLGEGPDPAPEKLASRVDTRLASEPDLEEHRQAFLDMLAYFTRDAHEQGPVGAGLYWKQHELDIVAAATLYATVVPRPEGPVGNEIDHLRTQLGERYATDYLEPNIEVHDLPAGPALRVHVVMSPEPLPDDGWTGTTLLDTIQYWVPVPGHPATLLLTFATPNLAAAELLALAEFDRIAQHLTLRT